MKVDFDTSTLSPWADISRILNNLKSLTVVAAGTKYTGPASLEMADGHATLSVGPKSKPKAEEKPSRKKK
jgi:hypothetical protein